MRYNLNTNLMGCPECMELLTRDDLEGFGRCPYCNHRFDSEKELEEFLLRPIVSHWLQQSQKIEGETMME